MENLQEAVSKIRSFNRFYTELLGLLGRGFLNSSYSLTEARVLLEISRMDRCTANALGARLSVDRSYLSRILKRFEHEGLIRRERSDRDNRVFYIDLTEEGTRAMEGFHRASNGQIAGMIRSLDGKELGELLGAMATIRGFLSGAVRSAEIREFRQEDLDYVLSRHKTLYAEEYGLSPVFWGYVERIIPAFFKDCNHERECLWIAEADGKPAGSIAIADAGNGTAQLRYFLLEPAARGMGLGGRLIDRALDFCREKGYRHVFLETFSALKTARGVYRSRGFSITATHANPEWGKDVLEERWDRDL